MGLGCDLEDWTKTFRQDVDCCATSDDGANRLRLEQMDGGGGPYWVISTERWAIDSIAEIVSMLRDAGVPETSP